MYCKGACSGNIGCDLPPGAQAAVVGSSFLERVGNPPARWVGSPRGFCAQVSFQRPGSAGPCAHSPGRADGCPSLALLRKTGEARPTSWLNFKLHWELGLCCAAMSGGTVRSLGKGSAPPGPVPEGLIRVYSMRFCPYAKRTLLVLRAKGIRHEVININLKNKPEWFFKKNPLGLVPVLETSLGQLIYESAITCEYPDEAYPGKKLLPGDPYEKACQKMVFESFSKVPSLMVSFLRKQNKEDCSGLKEELHKEFSKLEEVLTNKKTTFFGGSSLSMIDYLIWPWFEWLEALELNEYVDHTPNLKLWMTSMKNDPIVSSLPTDVKTLQGFFNLYLQNSPEACDYGL